MRRPIDKPDPPVIPQIVTDTIATPASPLAQWLRVETPGPRTARVAVTEAQVAAADVAVNGPQARAGGLSGAGVKIGIISDTFNTFGGEAADVAAGLLPANGVTVLKEGQVGFGSDEGRAMAQLVHATAPGAQLYFYSGFYSEEDMAAGIAALHAAGCQIIVDDVSYADEAMFQVAGPIDSAVQAAVSAGVDYFTAVGNDGHGVYQAAFAPRFVNIAGLGTVWAQTFAGGANTQTVTIPASRATTLSLQWDAPYNADNPPSITVKVLFGSTVIATSTATDGEPVTTVDFPFFGNNRTYSIAILYNSGTPQPALFKYVLEGGGTIADPGAGQTGSMVGHTLVPGVNAVGAVNVANTPARGNSPTPESFSSTGDSELLFGPNGIRLAFPEFADGPAFLAPDGSATSVFNPFLGTSAAAPVAAATAALMLQADPSLDTADITALLEDSALPAGTASVAGAGLIQANLATQYADTGVISGSPQTVIRGTSGACTIAGGGGSHVLLAGSGNTLIQSQGNDTIQTGAGADTVDLSGAAAILYGSTGATWVRSMGGNDTIVGGSGALTVSGGSGGGLVFGSTSGHNQLTAGNQQTVLVGRGSGDVLHGVGDGDQLYASSLGNETLFGGGGTEVLVGGTSGIDVFLAGAGTPLIAPESSTAVVTFGTGIAQVLDGPSPELFQVLNGVSGGLAAVFGFNPAKDMVLMSGFGSAPAETPATSQYDIDGNSWLKFPDGTIVAFVGISHFSSANLIYG